MSFSDQYRTAEWGEPPEPAPVPPSGGAGIRIKVLAVLAVAAIVALVGAGGMALVGGNAPSPTPTASPTPVPTPTVALQRYLKLTSNPRLNYHMNFVMAVDTAGTDVQLRANVDVAGNDWKGTVTVKSGAQTVKMEVIEKSGKTYARVAGGKWRLLPAKDSPEVTNPFQSIAAQNALRDIGVVKRAGASVHQLHMTELPNADQLTSRLGVGGKIDAFSFDVYVTDAGVPVQAALKLTMSTPSGAATVTMTFDFSRVGKAVKIVAPKL